jgi:ribosomal protein S13
MNTIKATETTYWILDDKHGTLETGQELATKTKPFSTTKKAEWLKKLGISSEKELEDNETEKLETENKSSELQSLKRKLINKVKSEVSKQLTATDYKVIRHRDQLDLIAKGNIITTTLTSEEYETLLKERNNLRIDSNEKEAEINSKTKITELEKIEL